MLDDPTPLFSGCRMIARLPVRLAQRQVGRHMLGSASQQVSINRDGVCGAPQTHQNKGAIAKDQGIVGVGLRQRLEGCQRAGIIFGLKGACKWTRKEFFRGDAKGVMARIGPGFGHHTDGADGEENAGQTPADNRAPLHVILVYRGGRVCCAWSDRSECCPPFW